jgi:hypothetical protein
MTMDRTATILASLLLVPLVCQGRQTPVGEPLEGQHGGPVTTFSHPRGWFTFEMPAGWTVPNAGDGHLAINPGLASTDTLDALVIASFGELDAASAQLDASAVFARARAAIVQDLAAQSIQVVETAAGPRAVRLAHGTGITQEWPGKAAGRDVRVWFGGLVRDGHYFTVTAVVVSGQESRFLPGVKRLLHTVHPRPPQRNTAAEQALVGARFGAIDTRPGGSRGSFSSTLEFSAGNRVRKTMMISGLAGLSTDVGGASEEWGTYEVTGDEVMLSFRDGADSLRLTIEQGQVVALVRGDRVYRRR